MVVSFSTVSEKGLVVIPKEIREKYGIKKGDKVSFVDYGGAVYFMRVPDDPIRAGRGMLKGGSRVMDEFLAERHRERDREEEELGRLAPNDQAD